MARYTVEQLYGFARQAGFSPDAAAVAAAVGMAESSGLSTAHNPNGEDSRGVMQINARAHPGLAARYDLWDPLENMRAAYEVSRGGRDFSPWTVTHGLASARYLTHQEAAQAAALAYGDGPGRGVWTGTAGYGHPLPGDPAGASSSPAAAAAAAEPSAAASASTAGPALPSAESEADSTLHRFLRAALAQAGDKYDFGHEVDLDDPNPKAFDCSELVEWAARQAGVTVPDGAMYQYLWAKERGLLIPVEDAVNTPGALLFHFSREPTPNGDRPSTAHVAISLGGGRTIEARNSKYPVGSYDAGNRFTFAAVIPGISDSAGLAAAVAAEQATTAAGQVALAAEPDPAPAAAPDLGGPDSDRDGLTDRKERLEGLDPSSPDTDSDTLPDAWELKEGTDPRLADTDGDLLNDAFEFAQGLDPLDPDTDDDGHLDGSLPESWLDSDADRLDDALEALLRLDSDEADTDRDGFTDGLEYGGGSDPLDPLSTPATVGAEPVDDDPDV